MAIPTEIFKQYYDETGDNNFTGIDYIQWLEKKLIELQQQVKPSVALEEGSKCDCIKDGSVTLQECVRCRKSPIV